MTDDRQTVHRQVPGRMDFMGSRVRRDIIIVAPAGVALSSLSSLCAARLRSYCRRGSYDHVRTEYYISILAFATVVVPSDSARESLLIKIEATKNKANQYFLCFFNSLLPTGRVHAPLLCLPRTEQRNTRPP